MEGLSAAPISPQGFQPQTVYKYNASIEINATIISSTINKTPPTHGGDAASVDLSNLYESLTGTAKNIIDKINELLKEKVPGGVQSLKKEDVTPEATADRIVKQITSLFDAYAKSNPNKESEEVLNTFMDKVREGVQAGYDDAFETLKALGAFEFDGVQAGVEKTKLLIESKLKDFERSKKVELGITSVEDTAQYDVKGALLQNAGGNLLSIA